MKNIQKSYNQRKETMYLFVSLINCNCNLLEKNYNSSLIHISFFTEGLIHHYPRGKVEGRIRFLVGGGFARVSNECVFDEETKRG